MKNRWNNDEAHQLNHETMHDELSLRVYSSRLLGQEPDLVLHGGGNTSVKMQVTNLFGEVEEILYVKGSGWDLATIEAAGFAPVKLIVLQKMSALSHLTDMEMVKVQRSAMLDSQAPTPSVEAILHAIIPHKYVDHSHADAVITITNTPAGEDKIRQIYGSRILIIPYVMPGFVLAKKVYEMTKNLDWQAYDGMILMNHGVFSFGETAKESYDRMINLVTIAENYLINQGATIKHIRSVVRENLQLFAYLRRAVSRIYGAALIAKLDMHDAAAHFLYLPEMREIVNRGPLTPDHVIRTKRVPVVIEEESREEIDKMLAAYVTNYYEYFARHTNGQQTCLNPAPCWAIWQQHGIVSFGTTLQEATIISDIKDHTIRAIQQAELLGGWQALPEKDIFDMEYWELEQAKLRKQNQSPVFKGKIALVTGAASGIGRACVEEFHRQGATVVALDINPQIMTLFKSSTILSDVCDLTNQMAIQQAVDNAVRRLGGLDIVVSNVGLFPVSETIADMHQNTWQKSLNINLSGHQMLFQASIPYLTLGIDPTIIVIGSKNVPAPGPGAAAYSVAKAGLTQLARVAALEWAEAGVRVNVIHPNAVFDTGIWTDEVLKKRAKHYGMTVEAYKTNNLLKVNISSKDVATLACAMAGPAFAKTTGAQVAIDGGNERVI